jgi:hypothetical protein
MLRGEVSEGTQVAKSRDLALVVSELLNRGSRKHALQNALQNAERDARIVTMFGVRGVRYCGGPGGRSKSLRPDRRVSQASGQYDHSNSSVVGRRSIGAVVIVILIRTMFAPPVSAPLVLAPCAPAPCTLPPAIVLPTISAVAIPSVVRTRRSGAQSGNQYDSSSEKKSRSAHGSLP